MLTRDDVILRLNAHRDELHRLGVDSLYLFGSVARGAAGPESDVDLFFETTDPGFSLFGLMDVQERVAEILGVRSDVMTRTSLHPIARPGIEAEAIRVF